MIDNDPQVSPPTSVIEQVAKAQGSLLRAIDCLHIHDEGFELEALHELETAHGEMGSILRALIAQYSGEPDCCSEVVAAILPERIEYLNGLKAKLSDFHFEDRAARVLERAPIFEIRDGHPYRLIRGIPTLGVLVQFTWMELFKLPNCGSLASSQLKRAIELHGILLGQALHDAELVYLGIPRVGSVGKSLQTGVIDDYVNGSVAIERGTIEVLRADIGEVQVKGKFNPANFMVSDNSNVRGLQTIGDLVQLSAGENRLHYYLPMEEALNYLLPLGLCMSMVFEPHVLAEIGVPQVDYAGRKPLTFRYSEP